MNEKNIIICSFYDRRGFYECKWSDERAFQALFIDYYAVLVSFAMKYLEDQEAAEDNSAGCICEDMGDSGKVGRD